MTGFVRIEPAPASVRVAALVGGGGVALAAGVLVYVIDRSHPGAGGSVFGALGGWLPSFAHTLAFSLFTAATLPPRPAARYGACAAWCAVNVAFELGQHPLIGQPLAQALLDMFGGSAPMRWLAGYFIHGTFDARDIGAAVAGALVAATVLQVVDRGREVSREP
jgi:hypothetical protein